MLCVALSEDAACCLDFSRRFLKEQLQSNLPDEVSHARVRVPVFFNAAQPQPILDAVTVPGLHVVTVPAAAGMVSAMALPNLEKNSPVCGFRPGTSEVSLHDPLLIGVFEKARLANAVWDAIALTFRGDTIRAKVYEAVDNTRQTQQEKNRERNLRWGNPRQGTEPLYIASSAATGACTRLEDVLQLTTVCGFVAPEIRSPARHVEGILACRGLVASLLCLALSDGCQEEAATEAKDRLPGSIARLTEPSAEEVHAASPPMAELVASVREEVRSLLHQAHWDANRIQQRLRHLAAFAQLYRNLASSRPSCCRISGLRDSSLPRQLPIYASVPRSCDRRS